MTHPSSAILPAKASAPARVWAGWAIALLATLCFSVGPPVAKAIFDLGLNPTLVLALRFAIATSALGATVLVTVPGGLRLPARGLLIAFGSGLLNGVGMLTFFWALLRISTSVASIIFSLYPMAVLALLALRGERFTYRNLVRLALGFAGVYLLVGLGGRVDGWGVVMVFIAIGSSAVVSVFMQWYLQGYDARVVTFYMVAGIGVIVVAFGLLQGIAWQDPGWQGWLAIVVLAIVSTFVSRLLWFYSIRWMGGGQVALLSPAETFLTVVWSVLFLGERLLPAQWIGGGLILLSMLLAVRRLQRVRLRPWRWPNLVRSR